MELVSNSTRKRKKSSAKQKQKDSYSQELTDPKDEKNDSASSSNSIQLDNNVQTKVECEKVSRKKKKSIANKNETKDQNQQVFVEEEQQLYKHAIDGDTSNMEQIIENWKKHISSEELENRVFNVYMKLTLNNFPLTEKVEFLLYEFLLERCFLQKNSETNFNINDIKKHIKIFSNLVDIASSFEDDEEISIFSLKYLAKEIYVLKHFLRSTYDKLPWEEMEFYLICYIISVTQQHELKAFYKAILKKSELVELLDIFSSILKKIQIEETSKLLELPDLKRSDIFPKIIENCPKFEALYNKFDCIRDIHSLHKISEYAKMVQSTQLQEKGAKQVIIRSLFVISQHLESTLHSPKLSQMTADWILITVRDYSRRVIMSILNSDSSEKALKLKMEQIANCDVEILKNDIELIAEIADDLLLLHSIRLLRQKCLQEGTANKSVVEQIENTFSIVLYVDRNIKKPSKQNISTWDVDKLIDNLDKLKSELSKDLMRNRLEDIENKLIQRKQGSKLKPVYACMMKPELEQVFLQPKYTKLSISEVQDIFKILISIIRNDNMRNSNGYQVEKLSVETINLLMFTVDIDTWNENFNATKIVQESVITRVEPETRSKSKEPNYKDYLYQSIQELKNLLSKSSYRKIKSENKTREIMKSLILDIISIVNILNVGNGDGNIPNFHLMLMDYLKSDCELLDLFFDSFMVAYSIAEKFIQNDPKDLISSPSEETKKSRETNTYFDHFIAIVKKQKLFSKAAKGDFDSVLKDDANIKARNFEKSTYLHLAVTSCDSPQIEDICDHGLSLNCKNIMLCTPLHTAAKIGNTKVVLHIVKKTKSVIDQLDDFGRTALHIAVLNGHTQIVQILIDNGSNTFLKDHLGFTSLFYAVLGRNKEIAKVLLLHNEKSSKDDSQRSDLDTLFQISVEHNLVEVVEFLLFENFVPLNYEVRAAAMHSAVSNDQHEILKILLKHGTNPNISINGQTPLHLAVLQEKAHMIPTLLKAGSNPSKKDKLGKSPLSYAISNGKKEILSLLSHGDGVQSEEMELPKLLDIAIQQNDIDLLTGLLSEKLVNLDYISQAEAIVSAVSNGQLEILEILLRYGADPDKAVEGPVPLLIAAQKNLDLIVEKLIFWKADVNIQNPQDGKTALHYAVSNGHDATVNCLLRHPAINVNVSDSENNTPLHFAVENGHLTTVKILLGKEGINVKLLNSKRYSALHIAVEKDDFSMVELLIEQWATIDSEDFSISPLQLAKERGNEKIAKLLLNNGASYSKTCTPKYQQQSIILTEKNVESSLQLAKEKENGEIAKSVFYKGPSYFKTFTPMNQRQSIVLTKKNVENPTIIIRGVSRDYFTRTDKEIIADIVSQNELDRKIKYKLEIIKRKITGDTCSITMLVMDKIAYKEIMNKIQLNIGWRKCPIADYFYIFQCYKCAEFNHSDIQCQNEEINCCRCSGKHSTKDCKSEDLKCINCIRKIKSLGLQLDIHHSASDQFCSYYKNLLKEKYSRQLKFSK